MLKEPKDEILELVNTALDSYNRKDSEAFKSIYSGDIVIVDGFAPFRWIGPGAPDRWWADAENWIKAGGVLKEHISFEGMRCCEVIDTRGYAVLSATLTITLKSGEQIIRPGILVYSFARQGQVWKAEGHTWGRLS